jgi:hypothetical protein
MRIVAHIPRRGITAGSGKLITTRRMAGTLDHFVEGHGSGFAVKTEELIQREYLVDKQLYP